MFDSVSVIRGAVDPAGAVVAVIVTAVDVTAAPPLSYARAVNVYVPAAVGVYVSLYGDVVSVLTSVAPL